MDDYTVAYADELAQRILARPLPEASRKLNKQGVVKHILAAIETLLARGFTIPQVADSMRGEGFDITTPTFKSYLQRIKGKKAKRARKPTPATPPLPPSGEHLRDAKARNPEGIATGQKATAAEAPKEAKSTSSEFLNTDRKKL